MTFSALDIFNKRSKIKLTLLVSTIYFQNILLCDNQNISKYNKQAIQLVTGNKLKLKE